MKPRWIFAELAIGALVLGLYIFVIGSAAVQHARALPDETLTPSPSPASTPVVITTVAPVETASHTASRPPVVIHDYQWSDDMIERFARGYWGLDTDDEKFAFTGVALNRMYSGAVDEGGRLVWGSTAHEVVNSTEFAFYRKDAPASDENKKLARHYLNVHATRILTGAYTGYVFPNNALYLVWAEDGRIAVTNERGGDLWIVR